MTITCPEAPQAPANLLREFPLLPHSPCLFSISPYSSFCARRHISACPVARALRHLQAADTHCNFIIYQGNHLSFLLGKWLLTGSRTDVKDVKNFLWLSPCQAQYLPISLITRRNPVTHTQPFLFLSHFFLFLCVHYPLNIILLDICGNINYLIQ